MSERHIRGKETTRHRKEETTQERKKESKKNKQSRAKESKIEKNNKKRNTQGQSDGLLAGSGQVPVGDCAGVFALGIGKLDGEKEGESKQTNN